MINDQFKTLYYSKESVLSVELISKPIFTISVYFVENLASQSVFVSYSSRL